MDTAQRLILQPRWRFPNILRKSLRRPYRIVTHLPFLMRATVSEFLFFFSRLGLVGPRWNQFEFLLKYHETKKSIYSLRSRFRGTLGKAFNQRIDDCRLVGWAYSPQVESKILFVGLVLDGLLLEKAEVCLPRPDVRAHFGGKAPLKTGFRIRVAHEYLAQLQNIEVFAFFEDSTACRLSFVPNLAFFEAKSEQVPLIQDVHFNKSYKAIEGSSGCVDEFKCKMDFENIKQFTDLRATRYFEVMSHGANIIAPMIRRSSIKRASKILRKFSEVASMGDEKLFAEVLKIVKPEKLNQIENAKVIEVRGSYLMDVVFPKVYPDRLVPQLAGSIQVPKESVYHLKKVAVLFGSVVVTQKGERFLYDLAADPKFDFVAGDWKHIQGLEKHPNYCGVFGSFKSVETVEDAILINGRCPLNYFHWVIEYLPRLKSMDRFPEFDHLPVIADERIPKSFKEALAVVAPNRKVIWSNPERKVEVKNLFIPSFHTCHPDTVKVPFFMGSALSQEHLLYIKEKAYVYLKGQLKAPNRKIFLTREIGLVRGLLNIDQITDYAVKAGFELVDPAKLSFKDQVKLFSSSKIIAGASGAAFANVIFCQPGTKIIALMADQLKDFCIFSNLAQLSGCKYLMVTGKSEHYWLRYDSPYNYMHSNYSIDPKKFSDALRYAEYEI